jgi:hypothetical protein
VPSLASHFLPAAAGMNAPGGSQGGGSASANQQGNGMSMEEMFMKHYMDKNGM